MTTKFAQVIPVIMADDVKAATTYYTEKLGFRVTFTSEWNYNGVVRDGLQLHIGQGKAVESNCGAHIYFMVDNVAALREEFIRTGALPADAPLIDQPYGNLELHVHDPFGYHLGFAQPKP